jgi:endonuclease/exonuclease/phosphatase family metal-dependent hydrolase
MRIAKDLVNTEDFEMKILLFALCIGLTGLSPAEAKSLKILTYNVWMVQLPFELGSKDINARTAAIPHYAAQTGADIIALQEVWPDHRKISLARIFKKLGYPYSYFEGQNSTTFRGMIGNGLFIVSKYPMFVAKDPKQRLLTFSSYTRTDEYPTYKGALRVKIQVPELGMIDFYNAHLGAVTFDTDKKTFDSEETRSREIQAWELYQFIQSTKSSEEVIVAADLNTHYKLFSNSKYTENYATDYTHLTCLGASSAQCLNLRDTYREKNAEAERAATFDTANNIYAGPGGYFENEPPGMIDYIFVSRSKRFSVASSTLALNESVVIPARKDAKPLSDHYGVLTTLDLHPGISQKN